MPTSFWGGFEKQAAIKPGPGLRWLKSVPQTAKSIDYSKLESPAALPMWKQKLIAAGKTPAKAPQKGASFVPKF